MNWIRQINSLYNFHISGYIESLPLTNTPEVFGLHSNAEIGYYTNATKEIWSYLLELQPQTSSQTNSTNREEFISQITQGLLTSLPQIFDREALRKKLGVNIPPITVVLLQVNMFRNESFVMCNIIKWKFEYLIRIFTFILLMSLVLEMFIRSVRNMLFSKYTCYTCFLLTGTP